MTESFYTSRSRLEVLAKTLQDAVTVSWTAEIVESAPA